MLVGLVGKNVILVVDFINNFCVCGLELKEVLIEVIKFCFCFILMINIMMVIGLMFIVFVGGVGLEWKNGLVWVFIGGLSSFMFLILIIVFVIYYMVEKGLSRMGVKWGYKVKVLVG